VRRIGSLMEEWGHQRIDLLKLSVEGSEYEILGNILAGSARPRMSIPSRACSTQA
jgi:hypothetical protein